MTRRSLDLSRAQILAFRRKAGALDTRLPPGPESLRRAAWAGLQDSMPRAAVLSIHARVEGTESTTWEDPSLVQLWGPRYSVYVVAEQDFAVFTLGRLPEEPAAFQRATDLAARLVSLLDGSRMTYGEAGRALGVHPNSLRYAAPTGTVMLRWEGARQPLIWAVEPPPMDPRDARLELARRYLHVFGPATPDSFATWAGIGRDVGTAAFEALMPSLVPARTPIGGAWILASDEPAYAEDAHFAGPTRLLPSGDAYYLLQGADREILIPDAARRASLWTSRVWPGAVMVDGHIVGTWRRSQHRVAIDAWTRLSRAKMEAIEDEARSMPLPGITRDLEISWGG